MSSTTTQSRNPFRSPAISPNVTAQSVTVNPSDARLPSSNTPTPAPTSTPTAAAVSSNPVSIPDLSPDLNTDEAPPAYTPSADPTQGETTVEFGPRRPFQQAPPRPQQPPAQQQQPSTTTSVPPVQPPSILQQLVSAAFGVPSSHHPRRPLSAGSNSPPMWTTYAGGRNELPSGQPQQRTESSPPLRIPPPRHPLLAPSRTPATNVSTSAPTSRPTSDFARDFYAVGSDASVAGLEVDTAATSSYANGGSQYAPPPSGPSSSYAPPPGPPPSDSQLNGNNTGGLDGIPDDGRPTTTPVPGHPLLKDGKLLVYPIGHVCEKCLNTGYKASDPSNPCRKCWSKYAKPFAGALLYTTPWTTSPPATASSSSSSTHLPPLSKNTFQRPLPISRPPQQRQVSDTLQPPPRPRPVSQPSPYQPSPYQPPPLPPRGIESHFQNPIFRNPLLLPFTGPLLGQSQSRGYPGQAHRAQYAPQGPGEPPVRIAVADPSAPPPPGSLVLRPGDPRLGGRLCWRCGGDGVVLFIFEELQCGVCGGVGRVFAS